MVTQVQQAWGSGPSKRYEELASRFRPIFERIRETAVERDATRRLPHDEIAWLKAGDFTKLRLPVEHGGFGATLPELFNLLIELSAADSNVTNALRAHFGFGEDVLVSEVPAWQALWFGRIAKGETVGSGFAEAGNSKLETLSTRLSRESSGWRVRGQKFYTTGSLFADWIAVGAADETEETKIVLVRRDAPGVEVINDWNGFGQALTASGTARFTDVVVEDDQIIPNAARFRHAMSFYQLVHVATLAGIGRAAAEDAARLVAERRRVYSHGNAARTADDPQILQVVGRVRASAYAAGAIALKAAEATQRVYETFLAEGGESADAAATIADVEINQAISTVTSLVLDATTILFDALGASAVKRDAGLDRYWRNARTISSHNPRVFRERTVGDFAVNGTKPPTFYRVGTPEADPNAEAGQPAGTRRLSAA